MTKIKLCGLGRPSDIEAANNLKCDYIGFVFAKKSSRYIACEKAGELKKLLSPDIKAVGVFVNEAPEAIAELLNNGTIDMAQLHGDESEDYIKTLRAFTAKPIIKAFRIAAKDDVAAAEQSLADYVLLDSGGGTGEAFNWELIKNMKRPYFLAGGLTTDNVTGAIKLLHPYAVDVSSSLETDGLKDKYKMTEFVTAVRKEDKND